MTADQLLHALGPTGSDRERRQAQLYLFENWETPLGRYLMNKGCSDPFDREEICADAILSFNDLVASGDFQGSTMGECYNFAKRAALFIWGKHDHNPQKMRLKRGLAKPTAEHPEMEAPKYVAADEKRRVNRETAESELSTEDDDKRLEGRDDSALTFGVNDPYGQPEEVQRAVQEIIDQLGDDCAERVRRSKELDATTLDDESTDERAVTKITGKETAADLNDSSTARTADRKNKCINKMRRLIRNTLENYPELAKFLTDHGLQ